MVDCSQVLKEYNLKVTPQRIAIVEEICLKGHINIDDLFNSLKLKFPSISLATIYKNIHAMLDKLFLSEVQIPNAKSVYELKRELHSHLICKKCNKIEDIHLDTACLVSEVTAKSSFKPEELSVVFSGFCKECR